MIALWSEKIGHGWLIIYLAEAGTRRKCFLIAYEIRPIE